MLICLYVFLMIALYSRLRLQARRTSGKSLQARVQPVPAQALQISCFI